MGTVAQGHEWEEWPVIISGGVGSLWGSEPALDLGSSGRYIRSMSLEKDEGNSPGMMETHHCHQRHEWLGAHPNASFLPLNFFLFP